MKKQVLVPLSVLLLLILGTTLVVLYGKGYRLDFMKGEGPKLSKTGLLHITSVPTSAQVWIDGHLTTASNNTINLAPRKYTVSISKDGYSSWQKDFQIEKEVVSTADAVLYPKAPTLQSISTFGVDSVVIDPSGTKLAFKIASQSAKKNGIYVLDMTARSFPVLAGQSNSTQIADDTLDTFSKADLSWSPDGRQILANIKAKSAYYLLNAGGFNDAPEDITATYSSYNDIWLGQKQDKQRALIKSLKPQVQKFALENFQILSWSPDETKILYQASDSAQMPVFLKPRHIGNNLLYERRDLEKGGIYSYNITEDVNTRVLAPTDQELCTFTNPDCKIPFAWFPDSVHLVYVHDNKIEVVEDDGSNMTTIFAGPFVGQYAYPWPDGSKLVILTNLGNEAVPPTLYTVGLK